MATARKHPKMDDLLQKLRRSIAELSLQGDDFTRQMWHMYNTFEDVLGSQVETRPSRCEKSQSEQHPSPEVQTAPEDPLLLVFPTAAERSQRTAPLKSQQQSSPKSSKTRTTSYPDVYRESSSSASRHRNTKETSIYGSPGLRRKRMSAPQYQQQLYGSPRSQHYRSRSEPTSNPLLDTISSVTSYDPCCDSDDYYDLATVYQQRKLGSAREGRHTDKSRASPSSHQHSDGDSIGYAGSNSIDSGYKSLCPTPEIPDSSCYGSEGPRCSSSAGSGDSTHSSPGRSRGDSSKSKILMGTRVVGWQQAPPKPSSSRKHDQKDLDANLDHLMYLRQSLINAIQRCESSSSSPSRDGSPTAHKRSGSPSVRPRSSGSPGDGKSSRQEKPGQQEDAVHHEKKQQDGNASSSSSSSSPSYQKTVRFNTDIKVSTSAVRSKQGLGENKDQAVAAAVVVNKSRSKPILKDPLCANLMSQLEKDVATDGGTLEEEIDSLLCGRSEYYDLDGVDNFPCSYVTMIEEKYKCGKYSVAKVKRLKEKCAEGCKDHNYSTLTQETMAVVHNNPPRRVVPTVAGTEARPDNPHLRRPPLELPSTAQPQQKLPQQISRTSSSTDAVKSTISSAKSRFNDVARCMLEIIEDLQLKKLAEHKSKRPSEVKQEARQLGPEATASQSSVVGVNVSGKPQVLKDTYISTGRSVHYHAAADYHVYEEILYDFVGGMTSAEDTTELPPPLPARPSNGVSSGGSEQVEKASDEHTSNSSGSASVSGNRPKQRSNLYSLITNQEERRSISKSLEQEWSNTAESAEVEDDYGFKTVVGS